MSPRKNRTANRESDLRAQRESQAAETAALESEYSAAFDSEQTEVRLEDSETTPADAPIVEPLDGTPADEPETDESDESDESESEYVDETPETPDANVDSVAPPFVPEKGEIVIAADAKGAHSVVKVSGIYFSAECGRAYRIDRPAEPSDIANLCAYCADGTIAPPDAEEPKPAKARATRTPRAAAAPALVSVPPVFVLGDAYVAHALGIDNRRGHAVANAVNALSDAMIDLHANTSSKDATALADVLKATLESLKPMMGRRARTVSTPAEGTSTATSTPVASSGDRLTCSGSKVAPASLYTAPNGIQGGVCSVCARRTGVNKDATLMSNHAPNATWLKAQTAPEAAQPVSTDETTSTTSDETIVSESLENANSEQSEEAAAA